MKHQMSYSGTKVPEFFYAENTTKKLSENTKYGILNVTQIPVDEHRIWFFQYTVKRIWRMIMETRLQEKCDLFIKNREAISKKFPFENRPLFPLTF